MPTAETLQLLREFGVPVSMLAAILAGIWQAMRWAAPRCDKLVDSHTEFVGSLQKEVEKHTEILGEIRDAVRDHGQQIKAIPCVKIDSDQGGRRLSAG